MLFEGQLIISRVADCAGIMCAAGYGDAITELI